ncbi:hypothetical protein HX744_05155 [Pseudonocardia sp. ICBG1122]|nr:hypothetical protein [Pseudonocardia pini]
MSELVVATSSTPLVPGPAFDQRTLFDEPLDLLVGPEHPLVDRPPPVPIRGSIAAVRAGARYQPAAAAGLD